ncbi:MAG: glucose-6-phosphate isomerase [Bacteroidetes bacterium]|nr:glucose-6-phosphate isomerase [Bacteroidota bacterium]MBL6942771.1 glucose-6-phosphate isomerase [Bacteroidales bacterium]
MIDLKFDYNNAIGVISQKEVLGFQNEIINHYKSLKDKTGKGSDFLGWIDLPDEVDNALINRIERIAAEIRSKSRIFVVVGIGGSYLGARAVIESLSNSFSHLNSKDGNPVIVYAGQNISEDYMVELLKVLDTFDYSLTVISKSGTTTEPAVAFRILKIHLENKYGKEAAKTRIIAITDKQRGALKQLADQEGYETFVVPDDVGGRYSILTPVGLLPIAIAGFNIGELLGGATKMKTHIESSPNIEDNPVWAYAAVRNALYNAGKTIEITVNYEPKLFYITEWWKQLFGESEGKENKGVFPAGVGFTTDLHSMGQYIQDGLRNIFETVISVEKPHNELKVPLDEKNLDGLNYIAGKQLHEVNHMAETGTTLAHVDGGVPNLRITIPEISEDTLGQLIYFYEMACAVSGYILRVNPFDQPGVEAYKKNMFALLGKPGFEKETKAIYSRLSD